VRRLAEIYEVIDVGRGQTCAEKASERVPLPRRSFDRPQENLGEDVRHRRADRKRRANGYMRARIPRPTALSNAPPDEIEIGGGDPA
jgi:hypothetical protein